MLMLTQFHRFPEESSVKLQQLCLIVKFIFIRRDFAGSEQIFY